MADASVDIGWNNRELKAGQREALKYIDGFENRTKKAFGTAGLDRFIGKIGGVAVGYLGLRNAADLALDAFNRYATFNAAQRGLEAMTGSAAEAERQLERLRVIAKQPGLGLREALDASVRLQAVQLSAEKAEAVLRNVGNALALVGRGKKELDGVILAFSQIISKGKVSAEEINQIAERLPQVRQAMQEAFGTANTEELQRMGVASEEFIDGIVEALGKLPKAADTTKNSMDNISDSIDQAKVAWGEMIALSESNLGVLEKFSKLMVTIRESAEYSRKAAEAQNQLGLFEGLKLEVETGDLAEARNLLRQVRDETQRETLRVAIDSGDIDLALARIDEYERRYAAFEKFAFQDKKDFDKLDINARVTYFVEDSDIRNARAELERFSLDLINKDEISELKSQLRELVEDFRLKVEIERPGTIEQAEAKALFKLYESARDAVDGLVASTTAAAEEAERKAKAEKEAAEAAKVAAEGQKDFARNAEKISKIQLELLPEDEQLEKLGERLRTVLESQFAGSIEELSAIIDRSLADQDFPAAAEAGKALIEVRELQEQINKLQEAGIGAEKAEAIARDAERHFRLEQEIYRLRLDGTREALAQADEKERALDAEREAARLARQMEISQAEALELVKERQRVTDAINAADLTNRRDVEETEREILRLRASGDGGGAAELEGELELRREALRLARDLNVTEQEGLNIARARAALRGEINQEQFAAEQKILKLRAAGDDAGADEAERELELKRDALRLQDTLNVSEREAMKLAKERLDLQDQINQRREDELELEARAAGGRGRRGQADEDGEDRKIRLKGPAERRSFLGIDESREKGFAGLGDQAFKGLDELVELQKKQDGAEFPGLDGLARLQERGGLGDGSDSAPSIGDTMDAGFASMVEAIDRQTLAGGTSPDLLEKTAVEAQAKNVEGGAGAGAEKSLEGEIATNTARTAEALEKLGAA